MRKRFDLYGFQGPSLDEAAQRLETALGLIIDPHESSYRGGDYYRGGGDSVDEVIVQINFEDEDGYVAEPDFPSCGILVYVTEPSDRVTAQLKKLSGLSLLRTEIL